MESKTVKAKWVGPFEALAALEDGSTVVLVPGETVIDIPADEAEQSAFWAPETKSRKQE